MLSVITHVYLHVFLCVAAGQLQAIQVGLPTPITPVPLESSRLPARYYDAPSTFQYPATAPPSQPLPRPVTITREPSGSDPRLHRLSSHTAADADSLSVASNERHALTSDSAGSPFAVSQPPHTPDCVRHLSMCGCTLPSEMLHSCMNAFAQKSKVFRLVWGSADEKRLDVTVADLDGVSIGSDLAHKDRLTIEGFYSVAERSLWWPSDGKLLIIRPHGADVTRFSTLQQFLLDNDKACVVLMMKLCFSSLSCTSCGVCRLA